MQVWNANPVLSLIREHGLPRMTPGLPSLQYLSYTHQGKMAKGDGSSAVHLCRIKASVHPHVWLPRMVTDLPSLYPVQSCRAIYKNHPEQWPLHRISFPWAQQSLVLSSVQWTSDDTMRKEPARSTVSNGAYQVISSQRQSIAHNEYIVSRATQDDPRPALAVKKKVQCTAPTPWQLSTLTHLLTPDLQPRTNLHTHPTTQPHNLYKSWSLHWSLSSSPTCSRPQKMRIHLLLPSASSDPSSPASLGACAEGGCCILNSVMISPTTLTNRSRSSSHMHFAQALWVHCTVMI